MSDKTIVLDAHVNTTTSYERQSLNRRVRVDDSHYESAFFTPGSSFHIPPAKTVSYTEFSYNMMYTNSEAVAQDFPTLVDHANWIEYQDHGSNNLIVNFNFMLAPEVAEVLKMQSRILNREHEEKVRGVAERAEYWEKTALGRKMRIDDLCGHWLVGRLIKWLCI